MKIKRMYVVIFLLVFCFFLSIIPPESENNSDLKSQIDNNLNMSDVDPILPEWNATWSGIDHDYSQNIIIDNNNKIYHAAVTQRVGGSDFDLLFLKYTTNGILERNVTWGGTENEAVNDIAIDSSGNLFITGSTSSFGAGSSDIYVAKFDSSGNYLWNVTWGGSNIENGYGIILDPLDNIYVTGITSSYGAGDYDICTIKFDNLGNHIWNKTWGNSNKDYGFDIDIDSQYNVYITGIYRSNANKMILLKYNETGELIFDRTWALMSDEATGGYALKLDNDEKILISGYAYQSQKNLFLAKYNKTGDQEWVSIWREGDSTHGNQITIDKFNNIYLTGVVGYNSLDALLIKFDNSGKYLWNTTWGSSNTEQSYGIALDSFGCIYISGYTSVNGNPDIFLLKYNSPLKIFINSPFYNQIFGVTAPNFSLDFLVIIGSVNQCWYSLNYGLNYTSKEYDGFINQTAWDSCENGTVIISFYANDTIGHLAYKEIIVRKDIYLPEIIVYKPFNNDTYGVKAPYFNLSIYDLDLDTSWYTINDSGFYEFTGTEGFINQLIWDLYSDGLIKIAFYANNSVGNVDMIEIFVYKSIKLTINEPIPNQIFSTTAPFYNISLIDWELYSIKYSLNGGINNYTITSPFGFIDQNIWNLVPDGPRNITFYAKYSSHSLEESVVIIKDTNIPVITINSPNYYSAYGNCTIDLFFDISIDEMNIDTIWYSLNNGENFTISETYGFIDQALWDLCDNGTVLIRFYVNDTSGNTAYDDVIVIKDISILMPRNAYAIVVGVEDYPGTDSDLNYCRDDAEAMAISLVASYNFNPENIILLLDSNARNSDINDAFSTINSKITSEDIFLFYFSGHGGYYPTWDEEYICPYDSINPFNPANTWWDWYIKSKLSSLDCAQKYVIIDACNSGGIIEECQVLPGMEYIMTSCSATELSYETSDLAHGVFTYFFLRSDDLASDSNGDGVISMEEQYPYIYSNVYSYSLHDSSPQEHDGISGQSVLYPSIGSPSFDIGLHQLNYSFYIYGHGLIKTIRILVGSVQENLTLVNRNLKEEARTYSGFGYYSGSIDLGLEHNITGYEILIEIEGFENFTYYQGDGDTDGDGLLDTIELLNKIDPHINDTDFDGLSDFDEYYGITSPINNDTDSDGLSDYEEYYGITNPINDDTDSDGLLDGEEVHSYDTNPLSGDTDSDTMPDKWEIDNLLNPLINDSDLDPDEDSLVNSLEYENNTDPQDPDTDDDDWTDGDEIERGTDPLDPNDYPRPPQGISGYYMFPLVSIVFIVALVYFKKRRLKK